MICNRSIIKGILRCIILGVPRTQTEKTSGKLELIINLESHFVKLFNSKFLNSLIFLTLAGSCITVADCAEDAVKEMNEMLGNYYCFDGYSTFKKACNSKNKVACEFYSELDSTSIEEIKKLCSENTGTACIILGALHQNLYNDAFKKDFSEAQKFYAKACDLDDGAGCYWLGRFSLEGTTGEIDHEKSLTYLNKACDLDDPEGCHLLGKMYETGTGVEKGLDSALKYYQKSCRWIGKGCESLSHLYAKGIGVKQDLGLAVHYYLLSEKGFNMSETYGTYGENSIIPASEFPLEEVKKQLKTGCDSDDAKSCLLYGRIYNLPDGPENELAGYIFYEKACDLNLAEGCDFAGGEYGLYEDQDYGVNDFNKAEKYLKKGCELNNAHACAHLAALYKIFPNGDPSDDKSEVSSSKMEELIKTADTLNQKACTLDPGMVFGNFQMTMDNVLMNSHDQQYSFRGACSKYKLSRDPQILMQSCDLNDVSACQELLDYHLSLPEAQHNYRFIKNLIFKIEDLEPAAC